MPLDRKLSVRTVLAGNGVGVSASSTKLSEYEAAAVEATVASSHCRRSRTLAVGLAVSGPLAGLKRPLGGLKCCDAGRRPSRAGSPGMQRIYAASYQQGSVESRRSSSLVLQRTGLPFCDAGSRPLNAGSPGMQHINVASCRYP